MAVIVTILVGFAMMTLGVALLLLGEVPFIAGKRISAIRSRLIGAVLVSFLPIAWGVIYLLGLIFGSSAIDGPVVTSFVFSLCCLAIFVILFRVLIPKRPPREKAPSKVESNKENPFNASTTPSENESSGWMDEEPKATAPAKKTRKPTAEQNNPFDFN